MASSPDDSDDEVQILPIKKAKLNEDYDEDPGSMEEIFYDLSPDCAFHFLDGKVIKFNKGLFYNAVKSRPIFQILFGPLKEEETVIKDIDSDCFKLFLDCVMEFKPITRQNALKIFPILWKYQVDKWLKKCLEILMPQEMDEEVCHTLNLALSYNCEVLKDQTLNFISSKVSPYELLENKTFMFLLEPDSLHEIIKTISLDSVIIKAMVDWGLNYLEKNNTEFKSVRCLFEHFGIMDEIVFEDFGTTNELIKFVTADLTKDFYSKEEFTVGLESQELNHRKSEWKYMKEGDELIEEISTFHHCYKFPIQLIYVIELNRAVYYTTSKSKYVRCHVDGELVTNNGQNIPLRIMKPEVNQQLESSYICHFRLNESANIGNDKALEIKLKFKFRSLYDCRILMTTKPANCLCTDDKTYFTKRVSLVIMK